MLLLHWSLLLLLRLSPSHRLAGAPFTLSTRSLRRFTAIRAEPESPPMSAAEAPDTGAGTSEADGEGHVELRAPTLFSFDDNPTPLQTATSVLLTGSISIFRSLRRRARRAKELVYPSADSHRPSYPHRSLFDKEILTHFLLWLDAEGTVQRCAEEAQQSYRGGPGDPEAGERLAGRDR
jgi:hypothetical protein